MPVGPDQTSPATFPVRREPAHARPAGRGGGAGASDPTGLFAMSPVLATRVAPRSWTQREGRSTGGVGTRYDDLLAPSARCAPSRPRLDPSSSPTCAPGAGRRAAPAGRAGPRGSLRTHPRPVRNPRERRLASRGRPRLVGATATMSVAAQGALPATSCTRSSVGSSPPRPACATRARARRCWPARPARLDEVRV